MRLLKEKSTFVVAIGHLWKKATLHLFNRCKMRERKSKRGKKSVKMSHDCSQSEVGDM